MPAHTARQYQEFQQAYDFYNRELFGGRLPQLLVTLQRKPKMMGHFAPERYQHRTRADVIHEIALNPDHFIGQTDAQILQTLVHEMVHVQQQGEGKPGRRGYHNKEWGAMMKAVGLYPSDTQAEGGREVGERMGDYVIPGGPFERATKKLLGGGFTLDWQSRHPERGGNGGGEDGDEGQEPKPKGRIKYTCPTCELNAWAKPGAPLLCGACYADGEGEITAMQPADAA